jgi:hypothetical protein
MYEYITHIARLMGKLVLRTQVTPSREETIGCSQENNIKIKIGCDGYVGFNWLRMWTNGQLFWMVNFWFRVNNRNSLFRMQSEPCKGFGGWLVG